jgi:ArsR family transcriptional regulator, arsenate/arsenite/antimonite-responsive transcriptional repressor
LLPGHRPGSERVAPVREPAQPARLWRRVHSRRRGRQRRARDGCDLGVAFDLSQPTISHHLKVLHDGGLLSREKRGVWVYYRACTGALASLGTLIGSPAAS